MIFGLLPEHKNSFLTKRIVHPNYTFSFIKPKEEELTQADYEFEESVRKEAYAQRY